MKINIFRALICVLLIYATPFNEEPYMWITTFAINDYSQTTDSDLNQAKQSATNFIKASDYYLSDYDKYFHNLACLDQDATEEVFKSEYGDECGPADSWGKEREMGDFIYFAGHGSRTKLHMADGKVDLDSFPEVGEWNKWLFADGCNLFLHQDSTDVHQLMDDMEGFFTGIQAVLGFADVVPDKPILQSESLTFWSFWKNGFTLKDAFFENAANQYAISAAYRAGCMSDGKRDFCMDKFDSTKEERGELGPQIYYEQNFDGDNWDWRDM